MYVDIILRKVKKKKEKKPKEMQNASQNQGEDLSGTRIYGCVAIAYIKVVFHHNYNLRAKKNMANDIYKLLE